MKPLLAIIALALNATAANLVLDGSFESDPSGSSALSGPLSAGSPWTVSSPGASYGVSVVSPPDGLGPVDPLTVGSPDPGGNNAAYFVTDNGINILSQTLSGLVAGDTYEVSFDAYLAYTGAGNTYTPSFEAQLGGTDIADFSLSSLPVPSSPSDASAWTHFYNTFTATSSGSAELDFEFITPNAGGAKDILLDRVYVGDPVSATPEPASALLFCAGLAAIPAFRRRTPRRPVNP